MRGLDFSSVGTQTIFANALIFLAVFAYVMYRQFSIRRVTGRTFVLVGILLVVGLSSGFPTAAVGVVLLLVSVVISTGFGVWRGMSMRLWRASDGIIYRRGTTLTIALWAITIASKLALDSWEVTAMHTFDTGSIWLAMAVTLGVQQYIMPRRTTALTTA